MRLLPLSLKFLLMSALCVNLATAGERPTCNKDTCDPRPDILPYWLTDCPFEYRREYNRPRYLSGKIAHCIEPSSQEAMVWCEANQMGLYNGKNCPPAYKQYMYPKPWEMLQTGPRPDFTKPDQLGIKAPEKSNAEARPDSSPSDRSNAEANTDASSRNEAAGTKSTSLIKPARAFHFN